MNMNRLMLSCALMVGGSVTVSIAAMPVDVAALEQVLVDMTHTADLEDLLAAVDTNLVSFDAPVSVAKWKSVGAHACGGAVLGLCAALLKSYCLRSVVAEHSEDLDCRTEVLLSFFQIPAIAALLAIAVQLGALPPSKINVFKTMLVAVAAVDVPLSCLVCGVMHLFSNDQAVLMTAWGLKEAAFLGVVGYLIAQVVKERVEQGKQRTALMALQTRLHAALHEPEQASGVEA
jgi:hypothetical protein